MKGLLKQKVFWLLMIVMVCAGASEQAMSQWASAFAESALHVSKTVGDLAGPCAFAICMGTARALYGKYSDYIPLKKMMIGSAVLCIGCYLTAVLSGNPIVGLVACALCGFSVGIFWPGTFSIAAMRLPAGGTAMLTVRQVGEVIVGAAEKSTGATAWPISMYNLTWKEFLKIVYAARGMGENRKIISVAPWMMRMGLGGVKKEYAEKGIESGIDVDGLADIMDLKLFIPERFAKELGATDDDINSAIFDSIKVSQASYDGTVKLLEMKGE